MAGRAIDLPNATLQTGGVPGAFPIEAVEKLFSAAEKRGVARTALLAAAGLAELGDEIGLAPLCALYEEAARLTGDGAFGLHVGEATSPLMYGTLGYIVANSARLGEALASLSEYQPLWTRAAGIELRPRGNAIALRYWHEGGIPPGNRRHENEQMLAALLSFVGGAAGAPIIPLRVRFEHRAPADLAEHRRIFASPLVFGAPVTEIVFAASVLELPLKQADPVLARLMRGQARSALAAQQRLEPFLDQLCRAVKAALLGGDPPDLPQLARAMGMGARTLQRRLAERGLTFRAVTEEARMDLAAELLAEPRLPLARIAFRLGFSQTSAFHRAFRRHAGTTPGAFRRALRGNEEHFSNG